DLPLLILERILDLAFSFSRYYDAQPVFAGFLFARCDDLDLVAAAQLVADGDQLMVDLCADALFADGAVDGKGKIQRRGPDGQHLDIAFRRVDVDLFGQEAGLEILQEIDG